MILDGRIGSTRMRAITAAGAAVRRGDVVVVPTEQSYALATDAFNPTGTQALRDMKGMDADVALPVMVASASTAAGIAQVSPVAQSLMDAFWPGFLTLVLPVHATLAWDVTAGGPVAVRMPIHPFLLALLEHAGPLAVSAVRGAESDPSAGVETVMRTFGEDVALGIDTGPTDPGLALSTIVDVSEGTPRILRRGGVSVELLTSVCPEIEVPA
jgi:L-threonylcarbamoyladenylate synthase